MGERGVKLVKQPKKHGYVIGEEHTVFDVSVELCAVGPKILKKSVRVRVRVSPCHVARLSEISAHRDSGVAARLERSVDLFEDALALLLVDHI